LSILYKQTRNAILISVNHFRTAFKKTTMKKSLLFSVTLILLACQNESEKELSVDNQIIKPTFEIAPPIDEFKPQTELFSIDNSKDTVLISDHGSFIHVPANSLDRKSVV
jgi:hypothetical protein